MALEHEIDSPFALAIRTAGSQSAFGRIIGRPQSSVRDRLASGKPLWAEDVLAVEAATGVPKEDLRPDLYPRDSADERTPTDAALDRRPSDGLGLEPAR